MISAYDDYDIIPTKITETLIPVLPINLYSMLISIALTLCLNNQNNF